ncbi:MAG: hypothetical protein ACYTHK_13935 [Planctomycetota bacterium]|jgi:hypothetical protein
MSRDRFFLLAGIGVVLWVIAFFINVETAMLAFLAGYGAVLFTVLGALFFVLLHHVVDAGWSTVARRWAEQMLVALPVLAAGAIIILLGSGKIYHWTHPNPDDALLTIKEPWLNRPFFALRLVIYFGVWITIARFYRNGSLAQDETGDPEITLRLRKFAGISLVAYGLTTAFAAIDLLMTPDHHWYSTMFGVWVWAQGVVSFFGVMALLAFAFRGELVPESTIRTIGLWLFAFAAFWGYLAASQWLLIWYANIPEETVWMIERWKHGWQVLGTASVLGLFAVPFVLLMPAENKSRPILKVVACIAMAGHWLGLLWVALPVHHDGSVTAGLLAAPGALLFVAGIAGLNVRRALDAAPTHPTQDPRLPEAVAEGGH